jgi:uncharacterized protein YndB with AHSA1/START domain
MSWSAVGKSGAITLERIYDSPIEEIWALWTTREGIESWWGPDGFSVSVDRIDVRPGGELRYTMTATGPEEVAFLARAGMPRSQQLTATYLDVQAPYRLAYSNRVDFIPGHGAYDVEALVELTPGTDGHVRMTLTLEAMHNDEWTNRAVAGWQNELDNLDRLLLERKP